MEVEHRRSSRIATTIVVMVGLVTTSTFTTAFAQPLPGGSLDPTSIPKYVTPLVIPPVMNNDGVADSYDIAVRQFQQQILPGGIWNTINGRSDMFAATTVWSYGPAADPVPAIAPDAGSQFNYPAYTVETVSHVPVGVRWINDLVAPNGDCRPHLLSIDQTLHWANPLMDCRDGTTRTDCSGDNPDPYDGPVPVVTHVHGAHVDPHSDGYPEAWWLPVCNQTGGLATSGSLFDDATGTNPGNLGYADYLYRQDQPATTLWYHDHSLGMTRSNAYAGPAGFWLVRGGKYDKVIDGTTDDPAVLPGPRGTGGLLAGPGRKVGQGQGYFYEPTRGAPGPGSGRGPGGSRPQRAGGSGPEFDPRDPDRDPGSRLRRQRRLAVLPGQSGLLRGTERRGNGGDSRRAVPG
jgi:hypothetical protein